ncbi:2-dehydro-3-deoxy-6-phosphogalactonate aldolase [Thalassotalea sp. M1531]|uniref:2-dehydro-3-deoxy-6-phosphogalactonate aldolase n=1 Tax=Thalassotalea algicola TaxID=2716224 RepID=A0A7Y0LBS2_9GAMM|nr:2-dehydro-3-deoxy-6-phosphogalactonate aldolase [Thalassotalea algicola]NMP30175.1 2-dehydro-3-deoxy-6-phosphogalactonate aldolase [Thalassotalea algicola]
MKLATLLSASPIIAILRGLTTQHAAEIGKLLYQAGIRIIEVPLNRPDAFNAIEVLANTLPDDCLIGAGTVVKLTDIEKVADAGGQLIVSPHCDTGIIEQSLNLGLVSLPGIATATEAFKAFNAGATTLKVYPANSYGPKHIQALKTVLPNHSQLIAVGGVKLNEIDLWLKHNASGVGIGNELFQQGDTPFDVTSKLSVLSQN